MSDSSPFEDAPSYEDAPADNVEVEDEKEEEEEEAEDDPFADVPAPSAQSSHSSAPSLDQPVEPAEPEVTPLRSAPHSAPPTRAHQRGRRTFTARSKQASARRSSSPLVPLAVFSRAALLPSTPSP